MCVMALCAAAGLSGCGGCSGGRVEISYADTIYSPHYAEGFDIFSVGKSSVISIYDPWPGAEGVRTDIFVSRAGELPPAGFDGVVVEAPLKRVVCMSASHRAFICELGQVESIKGLSGARYVYDSDVRYGIEMGQIRDVGYDAGMDYELIASLEPDIVFLYGVSSESAAAGKLAEMGVPSVHIGEFKESSPLGKAEWLVAFGEMYDLRHGAEREFNTIASHYNELASSVTGVPVRPTVMLNAPWRDTWYMPGDNNYMVRLIADAGGEYVAAGDDSRFSRPVGLEPAWVMAGKSDLWLNPNDASSIAELVAANPSFADIPAVRNGRVYNNTRRATEGGGSDFWESGTVRPDLVLRDMIHIFHPDLSQVGELYYFIRLE